MNYIDHKDHIEKIFARLNIQHIREFLMNGEEATNVDTMGFAERIEQRFNSVMKKIRARFPDVKELDVLADIICEYSVVCEDVYMEIGINCGFKMAKMLDAGF